MSGRKMPKMLKIPGVFKQQSSNYQLSASQFSDRQVSDRQPPAQQHSDCRLSPIHRFSNLRFPNPEGFAAGSSRCLCAKTSQFLARGLAVLLSLSSALWLTGCAVTQSGDDASTSGAENSGEPRIVATSAAVAEICAALDLDLVGVAESTSNPERYADVTTIGSPMAVDVELLTSLNPDYVLSPTTLEEDLSAQYEAAGLTGYFLDLTSIDGLYESIDWVAAEFDKTAEAEQLYAEYESFMDDFYAQIGDAEAPRVLILMGVPGSYIVATENSYVGSLVELVGAENIYAGTDEQFLNANTEDMLSQDPDIILRAAHGLPEEVTEMFAEEFSENDIWSHFTAVQEGRVYDLPYAEFGMSAKLNYTEALEYLLPLLYG